MNCYVYILGSDGGRVYRTYVGWTTDLERRVDQHNAGTGAKSTRGRNWVLLYRAGQHSIRINDQWRICFVWRNSEAWDVEIVDYHRG